MADQRATSWNFDVLGDDGPLSGNDNVPTAAPMDAYIVKNIDQVKQSLIAGGRHVGESQECVALVKHAIPEIGRAANWAEGSKINGYNDPPLEPGTALATFHRGKYQNNATGNHAGIFLRYGEDERGRKGFYLLDQSNRVQPKETFKAFDAEGHHTTSYASNYSVIRRPPPK